MNKLKQGIALCVMLVLGVVTGCGSLISSNDDSSSSSSDSLTPPTSISVSASTQNVFIGLGRSLSVSALPAGASTSGYILLR